MQTNFFFKATFLSILTAVLSSYAFAESKNQQPTATPPHANHADVAPAQAAPLSSEVLAAYLAIQKALAADQTKGVAAHATVLQQAGVPGADPLAKSKDLASARLHFKTVSDHLIQQAKTSGVAEGSVRLAHCPMAFNDQGGSWLQSAKGPLANPYYGSMMLRCGVFRADLSADSGAKKAETAPADHAH